ncbi:membrane hypothetical protein [uncultured Alphaproteobacteria bacterium]|uniref:Uncharacterized protein n=1 Tax=uncultured Alphaproteobacteria bacterium TaxID=91750 RepID=A0A212KLX4_9PROT|nr:membrane hypothetical protein [uncultured Alphaproteobacteria bacterium]
MDVRDVARLAFLAVAAASICAMILWTIASACCFAYATRISLRFRQGRGNPIGFWNKAFLALVFLGWAGALTLGIEEMLRILPGSWENADGETVRFSTAVLVGPILGGIVTVGLIRYPSLKATREICALLLGLHERLALTAGAPTAIQVLEIEVKGRIANLERHLPSTAQGWRGLHNRVEIAGGMEIEELMAFLRLCETVRSKAERRCAVEG